MDHDDIDHSAVTGAGIQASLVTVKGDLIAATASGAVDNLPAGANDTILMADSGQAMGLKWVAAATPTDQDYDDVASAGTADTYARGDHLHGMPSAGGGSATNLEANRVTRTAGDVTTTSTSFVDLTGASITLATGARRVLLTFTGASFNSGAGNANAFDFDIDGTRAASGATFGMTLMASISNQPVTMSYVTDVLTAASHTFKVQWRVSGGTGTVYASTTSQYFFSAVELYAD